MQPMTFFKPVTEMEQYHLLYSYTYPEKNFSAQHIEQLLKQGVNPHNPAALQVLKKETYYLGSIPRNIISYSPNETTTIHLFRLIEEKNPGLIKNLPESPPLLLHIMQKNYYRLARCLLDECQYDVDTQDELGQTTLYLLARFQCLEGVLDDNIRFLLDHNADPGKPNHQGQRPIDVVKLESVKRLLLESPKAASLRALYPVKPASKPALSFSSLLAFFKARVLGYKPIPQHDHVAPNYSYSLRVKLD